MIVSKTSESDGDYHTILGATGFTSGVHEWHIIVESFTANMRVGVADNQIRLNRPLESAGLEHCCWHSCSNCIYQSGQPQHACSGFQTGARLKLVLDASNGTLAFHNNDELVAQVM